MQLKCPGHSKGFTFWLYDRVLLCTPGKLSQVPPAELLIIGCDRHPEVPVTVKI